jgi:lipoyl(octanoyl) transferase
VGAIRHFSTAICVRRGSRARRPRHTGKVSSQSTGNQRRAYNFNRNVISVVQLGQLDYAEGLRLQQKLVDLRKAGKIGDVLLLLEHTPVITLGRNAKAANVLASTEVLAVRGVEVFECDRGGDVTFHGPGQLVGYPIFDLRGYGSSQLSAVSSQENQAGPLSLSKRKTLGVVDYVRRLEEVLMRTCGDFGIPTKRVAGLTGVWTESARVVSGLRPECGSETRYHATAEAKIAALGVHISRSVTSHGFALNVNTDLSYFNLIVPCGITAKPVTSMQKELGRELDLNEVAQSVSRNFGSVFGSKMLWVETLDALLGNRLGVPMKAPEELRRLQGNDDLFLA